MNIHHTLLLVIAVLATTVVGMEQDPSKSPGFPVLSTINSSTVTSPQKKPVIPDDEFHKDLNGWYELQLRMIQNGLMTEAEMNEIGKLNIKVSEWRAVDKMQLSEKQEKELNEKHQQLVKASDEWMEKGKKTKTTPGLVPQDFPVPSTVNSSKEEPDAAEQFMIDMRRLHGLFNQVMVQGTLPEKGERDELFLLFDEKMKRNSTNKLQLSEEQMEELNKLKHSFVST